MNMPRGTLSIVPTFTIKDEFAIESHPIYIYIYIYIYREREREGGSSNVNKSFIVNVRTIESAPRDIFSLNIHVLFRLNSIASMLLSLNNT